MFFSDLWFYTWHCASVCVCVRVYVFIHRSVCLPACLPWFLKQLDTVAFNKHDQNSKECKVWEIFSVTDWYTSNGLCNWSCSSVSIIDDISNKQEAASKRCKCVCVCVCVDQWLIAIKLIVCPERWPLMDGLNSSGDLWHRGTNFITHQFFVRFCSFHVD